MPDPVWQLYGRIVRRVGRVPSLVEWDEETPEYEVVVAESRKAAALEQREQTPP